MKKTALIAFLFLWKISATAQVYLPSNQTSYGAHNLRLKADSVQHIPAYTNQEDTLLHTKDTSAQIRIINGVLKYHYGYWRTAISGGGGSSPALTTLSTLNALFAYNGDATSLVVIDSITGGLFNIYPAGSYAVDSFLVFSLSNGKIAKRVYDASKPLNIRWCYYIKGDGVHDDGDSIRALIRRSPNYRNLYFPKGIYYGHMQVDTSDVELWMDKNAVFDGDVFHVVGRAIISGDASNVPIKNIRIHGELKTTERFGSYFVNNLIVDGIQIMPDSSIYRRQQADGGSRGVHLYNATKDTYIGYIITRCSKDSLAGGALFIDATSEDEKPENIYIGNVDVVGSTTSGYYSNRAKNVHINNLNVRGFGQSPTGYFISYGLNWVKSSNLIFDNVTIDGTNTTNTNAQGVFITATTDCGIRNLKIDSIPTKGIILGEVTTGIRNVNLNFGTITATRCGSYGAQLQGEFSVEKLVTYNNNKSATASITNTLIEKSRRFYVGNYEPERDSTINSLVVQSSRNGHFDRIRINGSATLAALFTSDTTITINDFYAKGTNEGVRLITCIGVSIPTFRADSLITREVGNVSVKALAIGSPVGTRFSTNPYLDSGFTRTNTFFSDTIPSASANYSTSQFYRGDIVYSKTPAAHQPANWVCISDGTPGGWRQGYYLSDSTNQYIYNLNLSAFSAPQTNSNVWVDGRIVTPNFVISQGNKKTAALPFEMYDKTGSTDTRIEMITGDSVNNSRMQSFDRTTALYTGMEFRGLSLSFKSSTTIKMTVAPTGVGFGSVITPSATLHLPTQTSSAGTSGIKWASSSSSSPVLMTAAESFAHEVNSVDMFYTPRSGVRYKFLLADTATGGSTMNGYIPVYSNTSKHYVQAFPTSAGGIIWTGGDGTIDAKIDSSWIASRFLQGLQSVTAAGATTTIPITINSTTNPALTVGNGGTGYFKLGDGTLYKVSGNGWNFSNDLVTGIAHLDVNTSRTSGVDDSSALTVNGDFDLNGKYASFSVANYGSKYVGVNNTRPSKWLDVNGTTKIRDTLFLTTTRPGNSATDSVLVKASDGSVKAVAGSSYGAGVVDSYIFQAQTGTLTPADATNIYFGSISANAALNSVKLYVPYTGTIKKVFLFFYNGGTLGTTETSTVYLRLNNTTDNTITSSVTNDAVNTAFNNTSLSIAVTAGDFFELKWTTPTWATNPTAVKVAAVVAIER